MPNQSSPHGGAIHEGTISHGTLRAQDLLRAFAREYERLLPFNSLPLVYEADSVAADIDEDGYSSDVHPEEVLQDLFVALDVIGAREGYYFGAHPGDGSDFGFWKIEEENSDD